MIDNTIPTPTTTDDQIDEKIEPGNLPVNSPDPTLTQTPPQATIDSLVTASVPAVTDNSSAPISTTDSVMPVAEPVTTTPAIEPPTILPDLPPVLSTTPPIPITDVPGASLPVDDSATPVIPTDNMVTPTTTTPVEPFASEPVITPGVGTLPPVETPADSPVVDQTNSTTPTTPPSAGGLKNAGVIFGAIALLVLGGGGFYYYQNFYNQKTAEPVTEKIPQIFVAQEVTSAERTDLANFASIWQQAIVKKLSFDDYKQLALGAGGRFKNVPVLKVGEETLYGNDLNYLSIIYAFDQYVSANKIPEDVLNKIVDQAMSDSTLLQEAIKQKIFVTDTTFFNNQNKNYSLRNQKVAQASGLLSEKLVQKISGEAVVIWFNNNTIPVSIEEGKKLALAKIEKIYTRLQKGEIDFKQAGEAIVADTEIGQKIDPDYKTNAYYAFTDREKGSWIFSYDNLNTEAWSLGEGQMSTILTGKGLNETTGQTIDSLYIIIKINKRTGSSSAQTTSGMVGGLVEQAPKENLSL